MGAAAQVIGREHVLDRLRAARVGVVIAPGGFGKSTLASMLVAELGALAVLVDLEPDAGPDALIGSLASSLAAAGAGDLAQAVGLSTIERSGDELIVALAARSDPVVILFDDVHRLQPGAAEWLATLVTRVPPDHQVVLLGRVLPAELDEAIAGLVAAGDGVVHVGADDLRFAAGEVAAYVAAAEHRVHVDPDALFVLTEGWPAAVALAAAQWGGRPVRRPGKAAGGQLLAELVGGLLAALTAPRRAQLAALARLPLLTAELADAVAGEGAFDALARSGLPLNHRPDGWVELPDPIREAIDSPALTAQQLASATAFYADLGDLGLATTMLVDESARDVFAAVLARREWIELEEFGLAPLRATLGVLGDARLARHPELTLTSAWVAEGRDPELRRKWLAIAAASTSEPTRSRVLAEQAREAARHGELGRTDELAGQVFEPAHDHADPIARGRALLALGQANTIRATPTALATARAQLEEAVLLFRLVRQRRWEADALLSLGYSVNFHGGRSEEAAEQLAQCLSIAGAADRQRAIMLTYYGDVLDHLGRGGEAEAAVNETIAIGRRLGDPMVVWFGAWSMMQIAAHRQDLAATRRWIAEAERHLGQWADDPRGFEFRLFVVDVCCTVGDEAAATEALAMARAAHVGVGLQDALLVAEAQYEATFGDPVKAETVLAAQDESPFAVDRGRWSRRMLRGLAAHRRGDGDAARRFVEESLAEAAAFGAPDLPARHEGRMVKILSEYLPAARDSMQGTVRIRLLGAFCVEVGGHDVTPQPGHPATLVKLLALRGSLVADEVLDQLWPEADMNTGRARLRNLLNRLRSRSGELVVRQGETLQLRGDVDLDSRNFEVLAKRAFDAAPHERAGAARLAAAAYGGDLLPGDRYEDWAAAPRERLRRLYVGLADLLADDAIERGDVDEAVRQLSAAIDADPLDDSRFVRAADLLLTKGTRVAARRMVERAVTATLDLGLPVTGRLDELRTLLLA